MWGALEHAKLDSLFHAENDGPALQVAFIKPLGPNAPPRYTTINIQPVVETMLDAATPSSSLQLMAAPSPHLRRPSSANRHTVTHPACAEVSPVFAG
jgi:hypothetical protein